jgi:hypothetical protein
MTKRQKYDFDRLDKYCKENNVTLLQDYLQQSLNSLSKIKGSCIFENCNNTFEKKLKNFIVSGSYCSICSNINKMNKIKDTNLLKYGYEFPFKSDKILNKSKVTCLKKFGVKSPLENKEILNKTKISLFNNYGVTVPIKNNIIKNKTRQTFLKKYGVENFLQTEEVKYARNKNCIDNYGVNYYLQSEIIKDKMKQNNIKKYNVMFPSQNENIMEKISLNSYNLKEYIFPSGNIIKIQGYEHFALNELIINENIQETDIITGVKNVPTIWYNDKSGKKRRHFVDIFIPSQNRCIEVKSTWTFMKEGVLCKQKAAKELGYKYEIWVYDKKGNKICYD